MLSNWRVGQTLNALVSDRMPSGGLLIKIGSQSFITSLDVPIQPGSRIKLEIQQIVPRLVLRLIDSDKVLGSSRTADSLINGALFNDGKGGLGNLNLLLKSLEAKFPSLSSSYGLSTSAIRGLLVNNFLVPGSVNASTVQAAFTLSGIFTEALWLSSRPGQGAQSSKTVLMILRQRITSALELGNLSSTERSALTRLFSSVESAIASIAYQQIASIPQDDEKLKWTATLPLQQEEDLCEIDVDIERQSPRKDGGSPQWKLRLSLELQALGPVVVLIEMINDRLRIDFSVGESVNARIKEALPTLRNQLIKAGLQLDNLSSKAFEPVSDDVAKMSGSSRLDISI
jgi:hypothetical protein